MSKDEFFKLPDDKRRCLVVDSLSYLIIFEDLAPNVLKCLISCEKYEVIKIVLGAYVNGMLK